MDKGKKKGRAWFWAGGILVALAILVIAAIHFLKKDLSNPHTSKLKPLITDQLKKMVFEASDSLYRIKYAAFDFNITTGNALITGFELIPDSAVYHRLIAEKRAPNMLLYFKCARISIEHFGFAKVDSGTKFNVKRIAMLSPALTVRLKRLDEPETKDTAGHHKMLFNLAQKVFKRMNADVMTMRNFKLLLVNENGAETRRTLLHVNMDAMGFMTTPQAKGFAVNVNTFRMRTPDSLYDITFRDMRFSSLNHNLTVAHAAVLPRLGKEEFYRTVKYAKGRFDFRYDHIAMNHLDMDRLLKRQEIHLGNMTIGRARVEIYKNYNYPFRKVPDRRSAYPNRKLQTLAFDITIDTTRLYNGDIYHTIFPQRSKKTATLAMTGTSEMILHMSNIAEDKKRYPECIVTSRTRVMNAGIMQSRYVFSLTAPDGAYTYAANMGPMDMRALNPLTRPLGQMEMKAGTITGMNMFMKANEYRATGYVNLYYQGMKVNLLKRDKDTDTLKRLKFLSFVTNTFTPDDNPTKNGKFRKGPINIVRDPHESFFGFMWRAMLDGSSSAMMGFDQQKKKPEKNVIVKLAKIIAGPRKKHEKRSNN